MAEDLSDRFFKLSPEDQADLIQRATPKGRERIIGWLRSRPKTPISPTLLGSRQAVAKSLLETYSPESTIGSRAREAAIGTLEPFTLPNLYQTGKEVIGGLIVDPLTGRGTARGVNVLRGMVSGAVDPIREYSEAIQSGDWDRAAHAAGGILSQTVPAVSGIDELSPTPFEPEAGLSLSGKLRVRARQAAQRALGAGSKRTTRPLVEDYLKKSEAATERQVESDLDIRQRNLEARQAAQKKNISNQFKYEEDVANAQKEAATKNAETQAKYRSEAADVQEQNRRASQVKTRSESLETGAERGSERFGEQVSQLDQDLRAEGNQKYDVVHQATAEDPGIPADDLAQAVQYAEDNILRGSSESIKQFRELGVQSPREVTPSEIDPARGQQYRDLINRLRESDTLSFNDLQGYSSELSAKLVKGNLPGDVLYAMKYVRDALDRGKRTIAERNGVGPALADADNFWRQYMDLFYDKGSVLAQVRERVGKFLREGVGEVDPQYFAKPIVTGEATDVARSKLYRFPSQHADRLRQLGDFAKQLQTLEPTATVSFTPGEEIPLEEARRGVSTRPRPVPQRPEIVGPKDVPPPEPVATRMLPRQDVPQPKGPTLEQFLEAKRRAVERASDKFAEANKWDLRLTVGAIMGMIRHLTLLPEIGIPILAAEKAAAAGLDRPTVIARITQLTPADLAELERLPDSVKGPLRNQIGRMLQEEERYHRISPSLRQFLAAGQVGIGATEPPANRREALQLLGR